MGGRRSQAFARSAGRNGPGGPNLGFKNGLWRRRERQAIMNRSGSRLG